MTFLETGDVDVEGGTAVFAADPRGTGRGGAGVRGQNAGSSVLFILGSAFSRP